MAGPSLEGIVNPDIFLWARDASRMDRATAARKIGVSEERLQGWEDGTTFPTLTQLRKTAMVYKRSVGVFFLRQRPVVGPAPADFRRLELSLAHEISPELANGIRAAEAKREAALEIYSQLEEEAPVFNLNVNLANGPEDVGAEILQRLGISLADRRKWTDDYDALNSWKAAVEKLGVLVMQVSSVEVRNMRGCSLAMFPLPVILLNSSDRPLGRVFTLIHELVHLARNENSLCDVTDEAERSQDAQAIEAYCNHVAGAVLVPMRDLIEQPSVANTANARDWSGDELQTLRKVFWASRESILRRLLAVNKTTLKFYRSERERMRQQHINDEGDKSAGFVAFSRKVVLTNGRFLTRFVIGAYDASVITGSELSRILGTKLDHLPKILDVLKEREPA